MSKESDIPEDKRIYRDLSYLIAKNRPDICDIEVFELYHRSKFEPDLFPHLIKLASQRIESKEPLKYPLDRFLLEILGWASKHNPPN